MQNFPKLQKKYDHVIIGFNLSSATFAHHLKSKNKSFCIVDSKHIGSSPIKMISSLEKRISTRVPFNPPFEETEQETPIWGEIKKLDGPPMTFEKGQFKSFLGFGNLKIESLEPVAPYLSNQSYLPQLTVEDHWEKVLDDESENLFLDQQITDIALNEKQVESITLNGKTQLKGDKFYFFDRFNFLFDKSGNQMKKLASQYGKCRWHSSVNVVIHHTAKPTQWLENQLYLLMGSKLHPCLGMFNRINGELISRWEAFFPAELTADNESTGLLFKEIKKQVKRAFDFPKDTKDHEHILVHERIYADMEKVNFDNGLLPNMENLYAYSPLFESRMGWVAEIQCGQKAAQDAEEISKSDQRSLEI